jgi:hypothetical protein
VDTVLVADQLPELEQWERRTVTKPACQIPHI